jgi:hypothetical protein
MTGARTTAPLTQKTAFFFKTAPLGDTTTIDGGWQLTRAQVALASPSAKACRCHSTSRPANRGRRSESEPHSASLSPQQTAGQHRLPKVQSTQSKFYFSYILVRNHIPQRSSAGGPTDCPLCLSSGYFGFHVGCCCVSQVRIFFDSSPASSGLF